MSQLISTRPAEKDLDRLQGEIWQRIMGAINDLQHNPRPHGYIKLKGSEGYRIRVGDYRILYDVDDGAQIVTIRRVQNRKDVYR